MLLWMAYRRVLGIIHRYLFTKSLLCGITHTSTTLLRWGLDLWFGLDRFKVKVQG